MKKLYFECYSGISGDMSVGALVDLGVDPAYLFAELAKLGLPGYTPKISRVMKNGIAATKFQVVMDDGSHSHEAVSAPADPASQPENGPVHEHLLKTVHTHEHSLMPDSGQAQAGGDPIHTIIPPQPDKEPAAHVHTHPHDERPAGDMPHGHTHEHTYNHEHAHNHEHGHTHEHRGLRDITLLIEHSDITPGAKKIALGIFQLLAKAEAKVHATTVDQIHFHEVGAVDSIVDIVGTAICIDAIKPDYIGASAPHEGTGFVRCQHGIVPVPAPATSELLRMASAPLSVIDVKGEMITPTGAAILTYLADAYGPMQNMNFERIGFGAGDKDFPHANILRVYLAEEKEKEYEDSVYVIETNIDDSTPEQLGYTMQKLSEIGVKDAYYTPIYMKKNRPAYMLSVICDEHTLGKAVYSIFAETSSIGVRYNRMERKIMGRTMKQVATPFGKIDMKECSYEDIVKSYPEYECVAKAAKSCQASFARVYQSAKTAAGK